MLKTSFVVVMLFFLVLFILSCETSEISDDILCEYKIDNLENIIEKDNIEFDRGISYDSNGSIKIVSQRQAVAYLYDTGDLDIEDTVIIYRARLKAEDLQGTAYLQMWCVFEGKGEYFSKGLDFTVSGTKDWVEVQTPFMLKKGENPVNIKLQIVVVGSGTVWIDDIRIIKSR
jgi:hypothetical protein